MQKENYFLVYPENKDFLSGKTREFAAIKHNNTAIVAMILLCILGICWVYVFISSLSEYIKLSYYGGQTNGQYVSQREEFDGNTTSYYITYKYIVDNILYIKEKKVDFDFYALFKTSEYPQRINLTIYYYKKDPDLSSPYPPTLLKPVLMFLLSVIWQFVGVAALIYFINKREKLKKLLQVGKIIDGNLKYCQANDTDDDVQIQGRYYFLSPRTRRYLEGEFNFVKRNDLKKKPLPEPDTPVKIMYWDDDNYEIL